MGNCAPDSLYSAPWGQRKTQVNRVYFCKDIFIQLERAMLRRPLVRIAVSDCIVLTNIWLSTLPSPSKFPLAHSHSHDPSRYLLNIYLAVIRTCSVIFWLWTQQSIQTKEKKIPVRFQLTLASVHMIIQTNVIQRAEN